MTAVKRRCWSELSSAQRTTIVAASAVQLGLQLAALIDLYRRPARRVNGDKRIWLALSFVNFIGPIAYFARGRSR